MNLEENFIIFKNITLTIIEKVKAEKYEQLEESFQQRQLILDDMKKINYLKEELKKLYLHYDIEKLENKLANEMKVKKVDLLKKLKQNEKRQEGMAGYNKLSAKAVFLSREI